MDRIEADHCLINAGWRVARWSNVNLPSEPVREVPSYYEHDRIPGRQFLSQMAREIQKTWDTEKYATPKNTSQIRAHLAGCALTGLLAAEPNPDPKVIAEMARDYADGVISALDVVTESSK